MSDKDLLAEAKEICAALPSHEQIGVRSYIESLEADLKTGKPVPMQSARKHLYWFIMRERDKAPLATL